MKEALKKIIRYSLSPFVLTDFFAFRSKDHHPRFKLKLGDIYPQLKDKTVKTNFDRHYIYHTAWAIRKAKEINPEKHVDISSTLYFSSTLSAFIPVDFYDYRPANLSLPGLQSLQANLLALPFESASIASLSCMHTIEHVGLGRYGDPLDSDGDLKAIRELTRVLRPGGSLLFVTPIGHEAKIEFNAHRIYTYDMVKEYFSGLTLKEFSLIPEHEESGGIIVNADPALVAKEQYACGCFWFIKSL